jgi:cell wall-associated NlpC family hydrolase
LTIKVNTTRRKIISIALAGMLTIGTSPSFAALGDEVLKEGMQNNDIKVLQQCLKDLGYFKNEDTTTYYGDITKKAVMDFQQNKGLDVDGVFGPNSYKTLINATSSPSRSDEGRRSKTISIISTAKKYLKVPYVFGGTSASGFDCSGYTSFVYSQNGISLPRTSQDQAQAGTKIEKANVQIGDLLIFSNTYKSGPSHAGIYLGNNQFIHASSTGKGVIISELDNYYNNHLSYGRRVY